MKRKKKEMILKAWESLEIKEEAEATYGKPVPLNRMAALSIWKALQTIAATAAVAQYRDPEYFPKYFQPQLLLLIKLDSLAGGGQSEIGQSIFGNSLHKNCQKGKKIKSVRAGRNHKLVHDFTVNNLLEGDIFLPQVGLEKFTLFGLNDPIRKGRRKRKL
nr:MAG TPA: hypothetical protein [Caudoviricetes sp.]